jgi:protein disulfide-isomerase
MKTKWSVGLALLMALDVAQAASSVAVKWETSYQAAMDLAGREDRVVMLFFTGSDWCSWCSRLSKEVFEHPSFIAYTERYLVPVKVDFPRRSQLPASLQQHNDTLANRFRVRSFPTVVFVDSNGKEVHRRGYEQGGGPAYLESLHKRLGMEAPVTIKCRTEKLQTEKVERRNPDRRPARDFPAEPVPLFGGAAAAPPPRYTNLVLKSITGTGNRRLALVNNQTLGVGETASVKLEDRNVRVRCTEIREHSVVVKVEGETAPREVRLAGPE